MFVAFYADAYFSVGGKVLLYFIVWVEVIEIEIWFEFKLVQNLEKIWKFKSLFPIFYCHGPNSTPPAQPGLPSLSCARPASWRSGFLSAQPSWPERHSSSPWCQSWVRDSELDAPPWRKSPLSRLSSAGSASDQNEKHVELESASITSVGRKIPIKGASQD
jgi:hypothetical protein